MFRRAIMGVAVVALVAGGARAAEQRTPQTRIGRLEREADRLAWQAQGTKGGAQQRLLLRRARLEDIIDRLEGGRHVDPREIDELLAEPPPS